MPAKKIVRRNGVQSVRIDWRESVRKWHPGQEWVWEPGGFGVCDPGINALSIFTKICRSRCSSRGHAAIPGQPPDPGRCRHRLQVGAKADQPKMCAGFNWLEDQGEIWTINIDHRNTATS